MAVEQAHRKTFAALLFSVLATVVGVGIVVPLLPVYAHDLGASGIYIGMIFGAFSLSRSAFLPFFGRISDRVGRKVFIVPGLVAYALVSIAYIYAGSVTSLIVIRFFQGVGSAALTPVIQAYVGDITPPGREGRVMGIYSMFVLVGLSLGPIIGGAVSDALGIDAAFACMGVLALVGFVLSLTLLPSRREEHLARTHARPAPWRTVLGDRTVIAILAFRFSYTLCIGIIWGFVPLYAALRFSLPSSAIGLLITMGILVSGILNPPMGALADRVSKRAMVIVGGIISGCAIYSFEFASSYGAMIVASALFGIGGGICLPALTAIAAIEGAEKKAMGTVMSLLTVARSMGMFTGALLGGAMMDLLELRLVFPAGAAVMTLGIAVFILGGGVGARSRDIRVDDVRHPGIDSNP